MEREEGELSEEEKPQKQQGRGPLDFSIDAKSERKLTNQNRSKLL